MVQMRLRPGLCLDDGGEITALLRPYSWNKKKVPYGKRKEVREGDGNGRGRE